MSLLGVGLGVVELVLDHRRLVAGHAELAQVALQADGEDDVLGLDACRPRPASSVKAPLAPRTAVTVAP